MFSWTRKGDEDPKHIWPTKALADYIENHQCQPSDVKIRMNLLGCTDVTDDIQNNNDVSMEPQIVQFAPNISIKGLGLYRERMNSSQWGGVLVRGLQSDDQTRRCLQYIYVYMSQNGVVSAFWNVLLPLLLGFWGFIISEMLIPLNLRSVWWFLDDGLNTYLFYCIPFIPFLFEIYPHYLDFIEGRQFSVRSTTLLPLYFVFISLSFFSIWFAFVLVALAFGSGFYWFADNRRWTGTSHSMDYVPVFVYLKKFNNKWRFDFAVWDDWHYRTGTTNNPFNLLRHEALKPFQGLNLVIDNPWHSMYRGTTKFEGRRFLAIILTIWFISLGFTLFSFTITFVANQHSLAVITCLLVVSIGLRVAGFHYPMFSSEELKEALTSTEARINDDTKLVTLWNLTEKNKPNCAKRLRQWIVRKNLERRKRRMANQLVGYDRKEKKLVLKGFQEEYKKYKQKGTKSYLEIGEDPLESYKLYYKNLQEEIDLYDDYISRLEQYDRMKMNPRLVVVHKMQNPFNTAPDFLDTFRDTEVHLYSLFLSYQV